MECILEGYVRAPAFHGSAPRRLMFDNLHSAMTKILHGHGWSF